jgi:hypothetical protein
MITPVSTYKMSTFDWSEFLAGSSVTALVTEGIRYLRVKKEKQIDAASSIRDISQITKIMREIVADTFFDRFMVFVGEDSAGAIVAGKKLFISSIYEEYDSEAKIEPIEIHRWQADSEYYEMFADMLLKGMIEIETEKMPKCKLKTIYESQGVKRSLVFHLATTKGLEKVFFCSIATLRDKEIPSDDKARVDSAVDRLRYIFEKYKKFH